MNKKSKNDVALELRDRVFGVDSPSQEDTYENMEKAIHAWLDDEHLHSKTRLTANQIIALTILKTLADKYDIKCVKKLIDNFCRYKLSEGGQSSKELVDILKNRQEIIADSGLQKAIEPFLK